MQQQTVSVENPIPVQVNAITGDLRIAGWERSEIMAKTDGDELQLEIQEGTARVSCDENLILYLPRPSAVEVESVAGDASLQALHGPLRLGPIAGDITMNDVGPINAENIAGDAMLRNIGAFTARKISGEFTLRGGSGACAIESIGRDASIRDVNGPLAIQSVGSDLFVRNVRGGINVSAMADISLYLEPIPGEVYNATAGDDMLVRLPADVNVELHLIGGNPEDVHVDIPGVEISGDSTAYDLTVGKQQEAPIAKMYLTSGDDLLVTCREELWESAADFGVGMADGSNWGVPPIPPLPPDFSERINRRVQAAMERAQIHMQEAGRRAEVAGRKAEAAVRRAEAKARAAEVRARRGARVNMNFGRWEFDLTPKGPVETVQAVSDEERLTILRMLREKKITMDEAEQLLSSLDGK